VLTTVIILVSSVVLGSGVVLYGTSLFQGGTQTENITVSGTKVWVHSTDSTGLAWGAAGIRNTGDKVVAIDTITVRGANIPFSQWYPDTDVSTTVFQTALNHTGWAAAPSPAMSKIGSCASNTNYLCIDVDSWGGNSDIIEATAASGPVSLDPGQSAIVYFKMNNGTITSLDSGISTTVSVFAGTAGGPQSVTVIGKS
ncbi:hypothetical protein, partial [Nitrosopumilus sp.]|uniref:hypothetical protein n=1 Tax=Nitrosopumilus sp. TaxID=2024843 RepID=UPI00261A3D2B